MDSLDEKVQQIKSQFPDRHIIAIDALDEESQFITFIMTSPERGEYRIYTEQMLKANDIKDPGDRMWKIREIIENHALCQIRHPSRETCQALFRSRPEMIDGLGDELRKAAGSQVEFRTRKL